MESNNQGGRYWKMLLKKIQYLVKDILKNIQYRVLKKIQCIYWIYWITQIPTYVWYCSSTHVKNIHYTVTIHEHLRDPEGTLILFFLGSMSLILAVWISMSLIEQRMKVFGAETLFQCQTGARGHYLLPEHFIGTLIWHVPARLHPTVSLINSFRYRNCAIYGRARQRPIEIQPLSKLTKTHHHLPPRFNSTHFINSAYSIPDKEIRWLSRTNNTVHIQRKVEYNAQCHWFCKHVALFQIIRDRNDTLLATSMHERSNHARDIFLFKTIWLSYYLQYVLYPYVIYITLYANPITANKYIYKYEYMYIYTCIYDIYLKVFLKYISMYIAHISKHLYIAWNTKSPTCLSGLHLPDATTPLTYSICRSRSTLLLAHGAMV